MACIDLQPRVPRFVAAPAHRRFHARVGRHEGRSRDRTGVHDRPAGSAGPGDSGPNVLGHGASSGAIWRIDPDHDLVIVVGRSGFNDGPQNAVWATKLAAAVADGLSD